MLLLMRSTKEIEMEKVESVPESTIYLIKEIKRKDAPPCNVRINIFLVHDDSKARYTSVVSMPQRPSFAVLGNSLDEVVEKAGNAAKSILEQDFQ